ncbi:MAG: hypothetical protein JSU70_00400 [Phycisphaerales bacterium]|nr:MAG: hypothetical protein JSU70_00400 [Phycisphaerales bacterium]
MTVLVLLMAMCSVVMAGTDNDDSKDQSVLTSLEQKMQEPICVDFRKTPIEDVIRTLAEKADVDIVTSPKVTGEVTATLTDVPLAEVLDGILASHGYDYITSKSMIRIAPVGELTGGGERLINRIYRITYANVAEVEEALKKFISKRGSLSSNKGSSNIIVTDVESKVKAIDTFIEEIDRITQQILVEARIYDITSKDRLDLGLDWGAGTSTTYAADGSPAGGNLDPFIAAGFEGSTGKTENTVAGLRFGWLNSELDIDVLLKAQKENIDAKLLANPRVLVLDNEKAVFKIVSEIPYQELTESAMGGSIGTTAFREVGVELEVTPHLARDGMIRLQLRPKFSVRTGEVDVVGLSGVIPQPVVDRREADTTLLVKHGQTVVLGGLRKKDVSRQINKIPFLGDWPIVGLLFRFHGESTVISELVVFITPWIIEQPVMSATEQEQLEKTKFEGPLPVNTMAETSGE